MSQRFRLMKYQLTLEPSETDICPVMSGYTVEPEKSPIRPSRLAFREVDCYRDECAWWRIDVSGAGYCGALDERRT